MKKKLVPELVGEPWLIGPNPTNLGDLQGVVGPGGLYKHQEPVDHHIWRDGAGMWRCWSCVRHTAVGRVFYGWESNVLDATPWTPTGVMMRRDHGYGESLGDPPDPNQPRSEWLQSPFVVPHEGRYWMFYGGGSHDPLGRLPLSSICLAVSDDGVHFTRHANACGESWVFLGPGEARDPCLIQVDGQWFCYYSGAETGERAPNKVYARVSKNLITWSASREVHWGGAAGVQGYQCECPHVVFVHGYYYLFRTRHYSNGETYVYRSEDPFDFGLDNDRCLVGMIDVAAPETVVDNGQWYISSNKDLVAGVRLHRMRWAEET